MATTASTFTGVKGPLRHRCAHCQASTAKLLRCLGCSAVRYCNREHQTAHWSQHKPACVGIKGARAHLAREEDAVRNASPDMMTPANAFETHVGHFWGLFHTRDYMRARFALADRLVQQGTLSGVTEALAHMRDMLRLCRSDNMGLRDVVPALMLRLDRDQDCYDFVKWWATCDPDGTYDWGDTSLPHLHIRNADVCEDPAFLTTVYPSLSHVSAVLLLKLKLLVDLGNVRIARDLAARSSLPFGVCRSIESELVRSPLSQRFLGEDTAALTQLQGRLVRHCVQLGAALQTANAHYVPHLFEPDEALSDKPEAYSHGSWEEMALAMHNSYAAWWETAGVLDLVADARAQGLEVAQRKREWTAHASTPEAGSRCAFHADVESVEELDANQLWNYLNFAVEDASRLGPRA